MANIIGTITSQNGSYFIKHADGTVTTAKVGDVIYENEELIGSSSNNAANSISVALSDGTETIDFDGNVSQTFDMTMLSGEILEDTVVTTDELDESLLLEAVNNEQENNSLLADNEDLTLEDIENLPAAAAGADDDTTDGTGTLVARLADRTGNEVDITTDLRSQTLTAIDDLPEDDAGEEFVAVDATLTLNNLTVNEGTGTATISASLDFTPTTPLTITLSNGTTLSFGTTYTPGSIIQSSAFNIQDDDAYVDSETFDISVTSFVGGGFNSLTSNDSVGTITDTIDTTTVDLSASTSVAEGGQITYTASVDNAPEGDLAITLSNGETITIADGQTSASISVAAPSDDVYVDGETLSVTVTNTAGGNYENLVVGQGSTGNEVETQITDTIDTVQVNLSTSDVNEDTGLVTFTASLTAPAGSEAVTVVTDQGTITIASGESTGTLTVDMTDSDVYLDATSITATITSATGGDFENLEIGTASATAQVADTIDTTTVDLSASTSVAEGGQITYTASVDNAPEGDLAITLSNGETITIADGQTSASISVAAPSDDVYVDGETLSVTVTNTAGGNYENLVVGQGSTGNEVETQITDTIDTTTVTLSAKELTETTTTILTESFENRSPNSGDEDNGSWYIENGDNGTNEFVSDSGAVWTVNDAGLEIQTDPTVSSTDASDGEKYAELDPHGDGHSVISTPVNVEGYDSFTLTFDYMPRGGNEDSSDMKVSFGDKELAIDSDNNGDLTLTADQGITYTITDGGDGWNTITVNYSGISGNTADLVFEGTGTADTVGAFIDDIKLEGTSNISIVNEGESETYVINIDNPPESDITLDVEISHVDTDSGDLIAQTIQVNLPENSTSVEFDISNIENLIFEPNENYTVALTGNVSTNNFEKLDVNTTPVTTTIIDNDIENTAPQTTNSTITTDEDTIYVLETSDFGNYSDADNDALSKIKITSLPDNGKLELNGSEISNNTEINITDISDNKLVFIPNENSDDNSTFEFQVSDGTLWSDTHTATLNILSVADIPSVEFTITDTTTAIEINEDINIKLKNKNNSHKVDLEENIDSIEILVDKVKNGIVKFYDSNEIQIGAEVSITEVNDIYRTTTGESFISFEVIKRQGGNFIFESYSYDSITDNTYNINIDSSLNDIDESESLSIQLENIPTDAYLTSDTLTIVKDTNDSSIWNITVDPNDTVVEGEISMSVPKGTDISDVNIKVTATESNDNSDIIISSDGDTDILILDNDDNIDLSKTEIKNIEEIDLTANGSQSIKLSLSDVLDVSNKEVLIKGTSDDNVSLTDEFINSDLTETRDGIEYNVFTADDAGDSYKVLIQTDIEIPIV